MPSDDERITTVQFVDNALGKTDVIAYWTDGSFGHLLSYFPDEISFRADDFIGLTERQARELHFTRDKEHLQS